MRATKYLFTYNDLRAHFNGLTSTTFSLPALKPGVSSWPAASDKCLTYDEVRNWLVFNGVSETQLPTWDDVTYTMQSTVYYNNTAWDNWGFNWAYVYFYMYNGTQPYTQDDWHNGVNLGATTGQASIILGYKVEGNWWSGTNTHWVWCCREKSTNAVYYGCFNDTRTGSTNCGTCGTGGNLTASIGTSSPKGCVLALVPYNEWLREFMQADNVGKGDAWYRFTLHWINVPWPY